MGWAAEELSRIDLRDQRLNGVVGEIVEELVGKADREHPSCLSRLGGGGDGGGVPLFLAQDHIEWSDILQPHVDCALM